MRYEAYLSAFDMLDQVHVGMTVKDTTETGPDGRLQIVLHASTSVQGEGITDPREWARDALIALLEKL